MLLASGCTGEMGAGTVPVADASAADAGAESARPDAGGCSTPGACPECGDGSCDETESCDGCPADCGLCPEDCGTAECDPPADGPHDNPFAGEGLLPAFPGAAGHGATALAGCDRSDPQLLRVTSLADEGAGTLRWAMSRAAVDPERLTIVVFDTGGLIVLESEIVPNGLSCIYVAGQTAPGDGITIAGNRLRPKRSVDLVMRYLRLRKGSLHNVNISGAERVVLDHMSISWGGGPAGGAGPLIISADSVQDYPVIDVTVSNSLVYEPHEDHPTLFMVAAEPKDGTAAGIPWLDRVDVWRNGLFGPGHRIPMAKGRSTRVAQNVVYNWLARGSEAANEAVVDFVGNYHRAGPATRASGYASFPFVLAEGCQLQEGGDGVCDKSYFYLGNRNAQNGFDGTLSAESAWMGDARSVTCRDLSTSDDHCPEDGSVPPSEWRRDEPLPDSPIPLETGVLTEAMVEAIVDDAGASRRVDCDGSWVPARDAIDAQRVAWFRSGEGFADAQPKSAHDLPDPAAGVACEDSDGDGMPDAFERRHGLDELDPNDAAGDPDGDGYVNLEEYVNGTRPQ